MSSLWCGLRSATSPRRDGEGATRPAAREPQNDAKHEYESLDTDPEPAPLLDTPCLDVQFDISQRFRAPSMLLFGGVSCIIGFVFITAIGVADFMGQNRNKSLKIDYPSGCGYWPGTVSEMVHNQESPGGRVFHTFGMMAGLCIFLSWYPFHLRNVYTGSELVPCLDMYWTTFRQLFPAMGLWLLIGVNTYPKPVVRASEGHTKLACVLLHDLGAGMLFMGYLLCELKCLGMCGFKMKHLGGRIKDRERIVRKLFASTICLGFGGFAAMQGAMFVFKDRICCTDEWALKGDLVKIGNVSQTIMEPQIVNTASGAFLKLKVLSFLCEDIAGIAMVLSHIAIWYFCEERHVPYGVKDLAELQPKMDRESKRLHDKNYE